MDNLTNQTNEIRIHYRTWFPGVNENCTRVPTLHPTANCLYPGMMVEMLSVIMKEANLKIVLTEREKNGIDLSTRSTFDSLLDDSYDLSAGSWQKTGVRVNKFDFTEPLYTAKTVLLRRQQENQFSDIFSFFHSYDTKTWLAMLVIWLIQLACCVLSQQLINSRSKQPKQNFLDIAWQVLRLQLLQPRDNFQHQLNASYRLSMSLFSFFQCYLLLTLFSSFILVTLLRPSVSVDNGTDFLIQSVGRGDSHFAGATNTNWLFENINHSKVYPYHYIRHALKMNPFRLTSSNKEAFDMAVSDGRTVIFQQTDELGYYLAHQYCELTYLEEGMPAVGAHLMMRKGHPLLGRLNKAIKATQMQLLFIQNKYEKLVYKFDNCPKKKLFSPLKIVPYLGASTISLCLLAAGIVALIGEFVHFYGWKRLHVQWS